jgi:hypothetical protein
MPVYLIDIADVDGGKGEVVERGHDGGDGSDSWRVQILFGVLENIVGWKADSKGKHNEPIDVKLITRWSRQT